MDILVKKCHKKYGLTPILNLNNLRFEKGAITGILGQNGTGKTTLLNILAGLDNNFEGEILYNGEKFSDAILKHITLVFQKPMPIRGTVYKNIEYPLAVRNIPKNEREKRTNEMLELFGLVDLKHKSALTVSGGEAQKLSLARALIIKPEVLLLDEPLSAIDFNSISKMEGIIKDYNKSSHATIIIITHNRGEADRVCDYKVFLNREKDGSTYSFFESEPCF